MPSSFCSMFGSRDSSIYRTGCNYNNLLKRVRRVLQLGPLTSQARSSSQPALETQSPSTWEHPVGCSLLLGPSSNGGTVQLAWGHFCPQLFMIFLSGPTLTSRLEFSPKWFTKNSSEAQLKIESPRGHSKKKMKTPGCTGCCYLKENTFLWLERCVCLQPVTGC